MMSSQPPGTMLENGHKAPKQMRPPRPIAYTSSIILSSWGAILGPNTGSRSFIPGRQGFAIGELNPVRGSADLFRTSPRLNSVPLPSRCLRLYPVPAGKPDLRVERLCSLQEQPVGPAFEP